MTRKQLTSKTASKKALMEAIKKGDKKELFHIYAMAGCKCNSHHPIQYIDVLIFCRQYLSDRAHRKAWNIMSASSPEERRRHEWCKVYHSEKHQVIAALKKFIADPTSNYAKKPMYGYSNLYFCSPVYGHKDYNKWRAIPIKGNERFCELIVKLGEKYSKSI